MRKFVVNVNGNSYEVEVEEVSGGSFSQPAPAPVSAPAAAPVSAPAPAPVPASAPAPAPVPAPKAQGPEGAVKLTAPMPGTILDIKVNPGDSVKKGTLVVILEAMKMENEIFSPENGTITTINVTKGQQVNSGDMILTIN